MDDSSVSEDLSRVAENSEQFLSRYEEILNPGPLTGPTTPDSISFESLGLTVSGLAVGCDSLSLTRRILAARWKARKVVG